MKNYPNLLNFLGIREEKINIRFCHTRLSTIKRFVETHCRHLKNPIGLLNLLLLNLQESARSDFWWIEGRHKEIKSYINSEERVWSVLFDCVSAARILFTKFMIMWSCLWPAIGGLISIIWPAIRAINSNRYAQVISSKLSI